MHYEDAVNEIYNFCIQNNSTAILSDDNGALRFGEIKTDELAVTTSNITTAITFLDSKTEYILVISSLSQTADIILSLMLRFFACCLCNYFVAMADGKVPLLQVSRVQKRVKTIFLKLYRKKLKLYDLPIKVTWRDRQLILSQKL